MWEFCYKRFCKVSMKHFDVLTNTNVIPVWIFEARSGKFIVMVIRAAEKSSITREHITCTDPDIVTHRDIYCQRFGNAASSPHCVASCTILVVTSVCYLFYDSFLS